MKTNYLVAASIGFVIIIGIAVFATHKEELKKPVPPTSLSVVPPPNGPGQIFRTVVDNHTYLITVSGGIVHAASCPLCATNRTR